MGTRVWIVVACIATGLGCAAEATSSEAFRQGTGGGDGGGDGGDNAGQGYGTTWGSHPGYGTYGASSSEGDGGGESGCVHDVGVVCMADTPDYDGCVADPVNAPGVESCAGPAGAIKPAQDAWEVCNCEVQAGLRDLSPGCCEEQCKLDNAKQEFAFCMFNDCGPDTCTTDEDCSTSGMQCTNGFCDGLSQELIEATLCNCLAACQDRGDEDVDIGPECCDHLSEGCPFADCEAWCEGCCDADNNCWDGEENTRCIGEDGPGGACEDCGAGQACADIGDGFQCYQSS